MNLVSAFQEMKRIYGFCPCCGELFRLSDADLFTRGEPPRTPFDDASDAEAKVARSIEKFEAKEEALREAAVALGQKQATKQLKKVAPFFTARKINPQDVKVLFDPVDYVAFKGMCGGKIACVELIDHAPDTAAREKAQNGIRKALEKGNVEWKLYRIDGAGTIESS
jgi:predicted Holliday junction resolvase-like endonuclease